MRKIVLFHNGIANTHVNSWKLPEKECMVYLTTSYCLTISLSPNFANGLKKEFIYSINYIWNSTKIDWQLLSVSDFEDEKTMINWNLQRIRPLVPGVLGLALKA